ncbi:N-myc-interactor isoform X1 [Heliangelus exortis]|uniref:N-myc-interactor isoform X1 n=1 Tax=Heliangelus exortis TaxID=472823 RepID=UPI003A91DBEA
MDFTSPSPTLKDNRFKMMSPDASGTSHNEMETSNQALKNWKAKLCELNEENAELQKEIGKLQEEIAQCSSKPLPQNQIKKEVAEMKLNFSHLEEVQGDYPELNTHCVFDVATKIPFSLNRNEALLTFEDEEVAQKLIKMDKYTVDLDSKTAHIRGKPTALGMGVKFELHVTISGKKINVSEVPELPIPEEWMRDKLELNFQKSEYGGGEVKDVCYDKQSGAAAVTFLRPGAANSFVRRAKYPFHVNGNFYRLSVSPATCVHLEKLQVYGGVSKKTILLKGIPEVEDDEESVEDMIKIHFQKPSRGGGEIENIKYVSGQGVCVWFEEDTSNST